MPKSILPKEAKATLRRVRNREHHEICFSHMHAVGRLHVLGALLERISETEDNPLEYWDQWELGLMIQEYANKAKADFDDMTLSKSMITSPELREVAANG